MRCLFVPCEADVQLETRRSMPGWGFGDVARVIPMHDVVGPDSWFGRCPASQIEVRADGTISATASAVLADAGDHFRRMMRDRIRRATAAYDAAAAAGDPTKTHPDRMPHGRPVTGSTAAYFPPRTGDEGERQAGDPEPKQPPAGVAGLPVGSIPSMENAREQLMALTQIAAQGFQASISASQAMWGAIDGISEGINAIKISLESTQTIARSAVGDASAIPEDAANMIHAASAALAALEEVNASLVIAGNRAQAVVMSSELGRLAAERYAGQI